MNILFAYSSTSSTFYSGTVLSTNGGTSWTPTSGHLVNAFAVSGTSILAGTDSGVFLSSNNGTNWTSAGLANCNVPALAVSDTNIIAFVDEYSHPYGDNPAFPLGTVTTDSVFSCGMYFSTNNGASWTFVNNGLQSVNVLGISGTNLLAGVEDDSIFLSTNNGTTWKADSGLTPIGTYGVVSANAFAVSGMNTFAGATCGVFLSTNDGKSWTRVDSGLVPFNNADISANALAVYGTNIFAVISGAANGVFLSTNNGTSWIDESSGLTKTITSIAVCDTDLFIGVSYDELNQYNQPIEVCGILRRSLSEMITAVRENEINAPMQFSLSQNYPNPFNPTTVVSYQLPANGLVTLKVYDVLGRPVKTLVDERQNAGSHSVIFNGSSLPSGVYFYRLEAASYHDTKKLLLLK
jgi:hypothetical protein